MAEEKPLTHHVNENVCLKPAKEKKKVPAVEVMHPWKQPKPEELRATHRTPLNDNLKRKPKDETRPKMFLFAPEPAPTKGPLRSNHYISESGAFEISSAGRRLVLKPLPSLPAADEQRKRFKSEHGQLFDDIPQSWESCVALVDRADKLLKEWKSKQ
jgi:hypothetical protein